jgi:hypothetical protein
MVRSQSNVETRHFLELVNLLFGCLLGRWLDRIVYNEIDQEHSLECRALRFRCRHGISESRSRPMPAYTT